MQYLLGAHWLQKERAVIDKVGYPCEMAEGEALKHFQIGPPHFMVASDWRRAGPRWETYALAMYDKYKVGPQYPFEYRV